MLNRSESEPEYAEEYIRKIYSDPKSETPQQTDFNLLIIGKSQYSVSFVEVIQKQLTMDQIIHVADHDSAVDEMLAIRFAIVIIDNQGKDIDPVYVSRLVRINNPLSRVIVISEEDTIEFIVSLINQGSVDSLIPLPIDDFTACSMVLEQQAKHEINFMLNEIIANPPKFSPAYYLRSDPTLLPDDHEQSVEILGCVISYQSVTRYSRFFKDVLVNDEFLLSGYISAMTTLGRQLFQQGRSIREINFGGISVFFHEEEDLHFSFFMQNLSKLTYEDTEQIVNELVMDIQFLCGSELSDNISMEEGTSAKIDKIVDDKLNQPKEVPDGQKPILLSFGTQYLITSIVLNSFKDDYEIFSVEREEDALICLFSNDVDVLLITPIHNSKISQLAFASEIKERLPKMQIIGIMDRFASNHLIEILNSNVVDMILSNEYSIDTFRYLLEKSIKRSKSLKESKLSIRQHQFVFSFDQSTVAKSLLRQSQRDFEQILTPELHGFVITKDDLPYYSTHWQFGPSKIQVDELMFAGFISSISSFSREMFNETEPYAGITFGDASLIILNYFNISFSFFVVNVDQSNYKLVHKHIEYAVYLIYQLITNTQDLGLDEWDSELPMKIEQLVTELFLKFSSISIS
ncbi:MAG: hypothetical protein ACW98K_08610 [Candidatus Kariarchaeaceae archaeon]